MCVCVISKVTERCRLIFCNIYFLVYIIGKKNVFFLMIHVFSYLAG